MPKKASQRSKVLGSSKKKKGKSLEEMMAARRGLTDAGITGQAHFTMAERQEVEAPPLSLYDPREPGARVGLRNQGNTCYMNSLLQTLYSLPPFYNAIMSFQHDTAVTEIHFEESCLHFPPFDSMLAFIPLPCVGSRQPRRLDPGPASVPLRSAGALHPGLCVYRWTYREFSVGPGRHWSTGPPRR